MTLDPGLHPDIPEADYHADPALSQSLLKALLDCPARFRHQRDHGTPWRPAFDLGTATHTAILGTGTGHVTIDAPDWRSKTAREARDAARAEGKVALLTHEAATVEAMRAAVYANPTAAAILDRDGTSELSLRWNEDDVPMRGRIDRLTTTTDGAPVIVDIKTTASAAPGRFAKAIYDYGYHVQAAAYTSGYRTLTGDDPAFLIVAVEKAEPYITAVYELDVIAVERGEDDYRRALDLYRRCLAADDWPAYGDDVTILPSPRWAA